MLGHYILDLEGKPCLCEDMLIWGKWLESADRLVANTTVGETEVSTVFVGTDLRFGGVFEGTVGNGPPLLWQTMIFGGLHDDYCKRYPTREEAVAGHAKAVAFVTK